MTFQERMRFVYLSAFIRLTAEGVRRWCRGQRGWERGRTLMIEDKRNG